jgi:hypothetical protein
MKRKKSCQGRVGVKKAHPIPLVLNLSLSEDRESASLLLDTPGTCATCERLAGLLVVVWLHPVGATGLLESN